MVAVRMFFVVLLATCPFATAAAGEPLAPAAGDRVVDNAASVAAALQQALSDESTPQAERLRTFVDTGDGIRIYHRDGRLLFAISTRRNLTASEKWNGERDAAIIARAVLQREFSTLDSDGFHGLDSGAVRVVFIEPDAHAPYGRDPSTFATRGGHCRGGYFGDGATPMPFAPAGYWAGGSSTQAPCVGCH
jgi:hypothetical protein